MFKLRNILYAGVLTIAFTILMTMLLHNYINAKSTYDDLNTCRPAGLSECLCPGASLNDVPMICLDSNAALAKVDKYRNYMIFSSATYVVILYGVLARNNPRRRTPKK